MILENTLIYKDIQELLAEKPTPVFYGWSCEIIAGGNKVIPFRVTSVIIQHLYLTNISASLEVNAVIPLGDWTTKVRPNDDRLEMILYMTPQSNVDITVDTGRSPFMQRFRCVVKESPGENKQMKDAPIHNTDVDGANITGLKDVTFQLFDLVAEHLRMREVGGIYRNVIPGDMVRTILGKESKKIAGGGDVTVRGVDIVPYSNTDVRKNIIIPHGTVLADLPDYVQKNCGGIYSTGIGYYLQSGMWYMYPRFDTRRYNTARKVLTVVNIPPNKFPNNEVTYKDSAKQLLVLNTGNLNYFDDSEYQQLNLGNGARFTDGKNITNNFGEYNNGELIIERVKNNSEFISEKKNTQYNYTPVTPSKIIANGYNEFAALARRECCHVQFDWENAKEGIIFPGMPCKIHYVGKDSVEEQEGIVMDASYFYDSVANSLTDQKFQCNATVTLLLRRKQA